MSMFFHPRPAARRAAPMAVWLCLAGLPAAAADVQAEANTVLRKVSSNDLDLASAAGAAMLHHRIDVAAMKVCEEATGGHDLGSPGLADCYARSSVDAWHQAEFRIAAARNGTAVASANRP